MILRSGLMCAELLRTSRCVRVRAACSFILSKGPQLSFHRSADIPHRACPPGTVKPSVCVCERERDNRHREREREDSGRRTAACAFILSFAVWRTLPGWCDLCAVLKSLRSMRASDAPVLCVAYLHALSNKCLPHLIVCWQTSH